MAKVKLPPKLDPFKNALNRSSYNGGFDSKMMGRLEDAVEACDNWVSVNVEFAKDAQGLTYFEGNANTGVKLLCQRCNNVFKKEIDVSFLFSPVQGADQDTLPEAYEPVDVDDYGEINLLQLIEDELILSLPIVALHESEACSIGKNDMAFGEIDQEYERKNPFAVLKELKRD